MAEFTNGVAPPGNGAWCVFRAGEQHFCLPAADVVDILFFPRLTALPRAPRLLLGIGDLHVVGGTGGAVVPVVDVRHVQAPRDVESAVPSNPHEFKYAVLTNTASNREEALLAIAADAVWHATTPEAQVLDVVAVAAALREKAVA